MRKRSRLTLVALAIAMAMVLSSCWQIRLIKSDKWFLGDGDIAKVTIDLHPTDEGLAFNAYPFVILGFDDGLVNRGRTFDKLNNYGGQEPGVKSGNLKNYLLNTTACSVGGISPQDVKGSLENWLVFRTTAKIDLSTVDPNDALRFKWKTSLAASATDGLVAGWTVWSGMWTDDNNNGVADDGEFICVSQFNGNFTAQK